MITPRTHTITVRMRMINPNAQYRNSTGMVAIFSLFPVNSEVRTHRWVLLIEPRRRMINSQSDASLRSGAYRHGSSLHLGNSAEIHLAHVPRIASTRVMFASTSWHVSASSRGVIAFHVAFHSERGNRGPCLTLSDVNRPPGTTSAPLARSPIHPRRARLGSIEWESERKFPEGAGEMSTCNTAYRCRTCSMAAGIPTRRPQRHYLKWGTDTEESQSSFQGTCTNP